MRTIRMLARSALPCLALLLSARADSSNTQAVTDATATFMAPLTSAQKTFINSGSNTSCLYNATLANAGNWSNIPVGGATRNGLQFATLSSTNLSNALAVGTAALSSQGETLFENVRLSDKYISGEVTNSKGTTSAAWGYSKYYIAFVGQPSTSSAWMLQLGGHHMAYNITYNGTYTSATPMFAGTEPNSFTISGTTYAPLGTQRTLLTSLRSTLSSTAAASGGPLLSGTYSDVVFGPNGTGSHDTNFPKSYPTTARGQLYSSLTSAQQAIVKNYITSWVANVDESISSELLAIYLSDAALAETYIGYAGSSAAMATNGSYFRIDGPRVWIEFSVQTGVYDTSSVHDHGVWRDKLADYGAAFGSTTISTTLRPPTISDQPDSISVAPGSSATFSVAAASAGTGSSTLAYQWYKGSSAISGATSASYQIASPSESDEGSYHVTVISTGGLVTSSSATLTVEAVFGPAISTTSPLADGMVGAAYAQQFAASGGTGSYTWSLASGSLPEGVTLSNSGSLSGTPDAAGTFNFSVQVRDAASATASAAFVLTVSEPLAVFLEENGLGDDSAESDSDGDGVSNLLEFVLGGDPTNPDSSVLPTGSFDSSTSVFTYTFHVPEYAGSVTWTCQYTADFVTWTDAADGADGVTIESGDAVDGDIEVTVSIPAITEKLFARLQAIAP